MKKTPKEIKNKIFKALSKGAIKPQLLKHTTEWTLYRVLTKEERKHAKALHDTLIDNIFS